MNKWYYAKDNKQHGPVDKTQLINLLQEGSLNAEDLVWSNGMENWVKIGTLSEFADKLQEANPRNGTEHNRSESKFVNLEEVRYGGFWLRLVALFIDMIIITIITIIPAMFMISGDPDMDNATANFLGFFITWLYYSLMESSGHQATYGKKLLGLKVTTENGYPVKFGKATGRHFSKILSGLIFGIGYLMAAFTKKKQGLHDMIAGCIIVKA
ncbi:RDD family protein [Rhodohalobacter sulfatireducens]|uniref:RDD family protein n=1 Tax=Rhodohalobacter sulfatireducens TaxID=2911366 RepID=A0ABS9KAA6_9BACT|nr:RDD family protein [Rhodohalobacter sulfatireducens]MCG2587779.1 RDD family protein [Rhodohalobacter sulfatireducens]